MAVCGLPDPRRDHAIVMAKFAHECLRKMERLTTELEVELGPDTADLGLRVGLHSGPVVAGVLRGEKSRFQLFGDTMNTASRMESNGVPNRIQISQDTADLLIAAGKHHWCIAREDKIKAKGKGMLSTYWLMTGGGGGGAKSNLTSDMSVGSHDLSLDGFDLRDHVEAMEKKNRIADWTVEIMACLLKEIAARRKAASTKRGSKGDMFVALGSKKKSQKNLFATHTKDATVIDEVQEIIMLPEYDADVARKEASLDPNEITLSQDVFDELRDYIRTIASLYNENPFHNFAHANHVTVSIFALLWSHKFHFYVV